MDINMPIIKTSFFIQVILSSILFFSFNFLSDAFYKTQSKEVFQKILIDQSEHESVFIFKNQDQKDVKIFFNANFKTKLLENGSVEFTFDNNKKYVFIGSTLEDLTLLFTKYRIIELYYERSENTTFVRVDKND